ncbi:DinB family protein [bacterium]|nr:MAG: DinB family protein [bacterium]
MSTLAPLIEAWDEAYREFSIAMEGMPEEDLWKRAHPRLLSVGELAGHIAYWQAVGVMGGGNDRPDIGSLPIKSPLLDNAFRYYTTNVDHVFRVDLDVAQTLGEVQRIHEAAKAELGDKDLDTPYAGQWKTWGNLVKYQVFHVSYHTGQAYSVRHLLGHETEDN